MNDLTDAQRIYEQWHEFAKSGNVEALMSLYAPDAIRETPLTMAILDDAKSGILRGTELRRFFEEGVRRRPNKLVRWYRDGAFFWNGHRLVWEYPRQTPDGDQVDILEVMDIAEGKSRIIVSIGAGLDLNCSSNHFLKNRYTCKDPIYRVCDLSKHVLSKIYNGMYS